VPLGSLDAPAVDPGNVRAKRRARFGFV